MKNISINGFGRIGRTTVRVWHKTAFDKVNLKVINTSGSMELDSWAHLLKYDTNYGVFGGQVQTETLRTAKEALAENKPMGYLIIDGHKILVTAQRDPSLLPWAEHDIDVVIESTGAFTDSEKASAHIKAGAKRVLISAPAKGDGVSTSVLGVNDFDDNATIISNASCTTNCISPVVQILHSKIGIEKALMTTIHAFTDDQNLQDNSHKDLRRARSASENIVPTSTGAAKTTTEIIPELKGIFDGLALRVPVKTGSLSDIVFVAKRNVTKEEVNQILSDASKEPRWQGILAVTTEPIVSSDIIGRSESSIVDLELTNVVGGNLVKVVTWYDNEWGYCNRLVEQVV